MTLEQALNVTPAELNQMTKAQLKPLVQKLGKTTRGRVQTMKKAEARGETVYSQAKTQLEASGGSIKTKGLNLNQLRSEYKRARQFLTSKTGSLTGARQIRADILKQFGFDNSATNADIAKAFEALHKLQEDFSAEFMQQMGHDFYKSITGEIGRAIKSGESDTLNNIANAANKLYEEFMSRAQTPNFDYENFLYEPN